MDGIHDLGGRHGFGPVDRHGEDEAFHESWEERVLGIVRGMSRPADWSIDWFRHCRELIDPADYLTRPYYDQWLQTYAAMMVNSGVATVGELASGKSDRANPGPAPPMPPESVVSATSAVMRFDRERRWQCQCSRPGLPYGRLDKAWPATPVCRPTRAAAAVLSTATTARPFCRTRRHMVKTGRSRSTLLSSTRRSYGERHAATGSISTCGKATLSGPEQIAPLARHDGAPAFDEPWQAQVLGLAYALSKAGLFTPAAWSETLGAELRRAAVGGAADDQSTYYAAALAALERLTAAADGGVSGNDLSARVAQWRRAYLNTPHGKPVELAAGGEG